jgi:adenylate kinase family enzyme
MRIAITGPSGSGKTTLAGRIAQLTGGPHTEIDGLFHGPGWEPRPEFSDEVRAFTAADTWTTEWQYSSVRELLAERADLLVWLDLPVPLVMWRLLRRTHVRNRDRVELWNGNVEPGWRTSATSLIWPALQRAFRNRRTFPTRYAGVNVRRLRSDAEVRELVRELAAR